MTIDFNKNYYDILGIKSDALEKEIKKAYYKLSFDYHPDKNKDVDPTKFNSITEAYDILSNIELRNQYDKKSKWGRDYNEMEALFIVDVEFNYDNEKNKFEDFKKNQILNVIEKVDENFNGTIEYARWVICKDCGGSGKDLKSKFVIKDEFGNIKGIFDSEDGCDFCEGTGKNYLGEKCGFCFGEGKVGNRDCEKCGGERRILGKQKLSNIVLGEDEKTVIKHMGHFSKSEPGKVGDLILVKKS